jgi:hypothetical protein
MFYVHQRFGEYLPNISCIIIVTTISDLRRIQVSTLHFFKYKISFLLHSLPPVGRLVVAPVESRPRVPLLLAISSLTQRHSRSQQDNSKEVTQSRSYVHVLYIIEAAPYWTQNDWPAIHAFLISKMDRASLT